MEKVTNKVARFIELSAKFSKSFNEIFPNEPNGFYNTGTSSIGIGIGSLCIGNNTNSLTVTGGFILNGREIYIDDNGDVKSRDKKPLTKADEIRAKAEIKAKLSDEFDEYNKLRIDLGNYFSALKNVIE